MRINEFTAVSTSRVLLVPYEARHVLTYHAWMEDPAIQEATASERLTLEEEYENQQSWRTAHDKLTFIVCHPLSSTPLIFSEKGSLSVLAGEVDSPDRMVGDINFFLYPYDSDGSDNSTDDDGLCGEVDIMIANPNDRGKGVGRAAALAFLHYIFSHLPLILNEYHTPNDHQKENIRPDSKGGSRLKQLMVKIKADNTHSINLFKSLGFQQDGEVNYFGEVKLTLTEFDAFREENVVPEGYVELVYQQQPPN
ncbi:GNAT domain-containing protein [Diplogelasinospora grovesii]|uniref:GNAT domain-containing protein n=1 Tax=Diplogelasinospora grovesii TaxID=303347 RepID=A0AAN6NED0_9PEZI|nr:GNAT domain-containing protein [Diplogelasinospora grovesii]